MNFSGGGLLRNFGKGGGSFTGSFIDLQLNDARRFLVRSSGQTGIATATPFAMLSVTASSTLATEYAFGVADSSNVPLLLVTNAGRVGIGTTSPASTFTVTGSGCISGGAGATVACPTTAGTLNFRAGGVANVDLAEMYRAADLALEAGDIVSFSDMSSVVPAVTKATTSSRIIGIVSTAPGLTLGGANQEYQGADMRPIALAGRVPVKVSTENGPVKIGDRIALSNINGIGMKATTSGITIAVALGNFDPQNGANGEGTTTPTEVTVNGNTYAQGTILAFINLSYVEIANPYQSITVADLADQLAGTVAIEEGSIAGRFLTNLFGRLVQWFASVGNGIGDFFANRVRTKELCVGDETGSETCITKAQLDALLAGTGATSQTSGGNGNGGGSGGGGGGVPAQEPAPNLETGTPSTTDTSTSTTEPAPELAPEPSPTQTTEPTPIDEPTPEPESTASEPVPTDTPTTEPAPTTDTTTATEPEQTPVPTDDGGTGQATEPELAPEPTPGPEPAP